MYTNMKLNQEMVAMLAAEAEVAVARTQPEGVIFQMMDNFIYMARQPDGSTSHYTKGKDGKFHVPGELTVVEKSVQYNMYIVQHAETSSQCRRGLPNAQ